jgi:hypothetical protein
MDIMELSGVNDGAFAVKKIMELNGQYFAEIKPGGKSFKIEISFSDFHKILISYAESKLIFCYPLGGEPSGDTYNNSIYKLEII